MACLLVAPPGSTEKVPAIGLGSHDFPPATGFPGPWRKLVVEVRPDKILPFWWDEKTKKLAPLGQGLDAKGLKFVTKSLQQEANKLKNLPSAPRAIEALQPRSALGLYAFRSKASFRNVVIEPLSPDLRARAATLADDVGLAAAVLDSPVGGLEQTARLRVRLGRALALNPALVLIEHPPSNVSRDRVAPLGRDIRATMAKRGATAITLTADKDLAQAIADRALKLEPGTGRLTVLGASWLDRLRNR